MFRIYFRVSPTARLLYSPLDDPFGVFGELGGLDRGASLFGVQTEDDLADAVFLQAHLAQDFRRPALFLLYQPQQQVLRAHIEVAHAPGRLFGQAEHPFCFRRKHLPVVFHRPQLPPAVPPRPLLLPNGLPAAGSAPGGGAPAPSG